VEGGLLFLTVGHGARFAVHDSGAQGRFAVSDMGHGARLIGTHCVLLG